MDTPGKPVAQPPQLPVLRPEVVAPLADAVGFVHRHRLHLALRQQPHEAVAALADEPFRRDVEQAIAALPQRLDHPRLVGRPQRRCCRSPPATPLATSPSTWSFISEMSGETTTDSPSRAAAGA